jgi:hypothetical protein
MSDTLGGLIDKLFTVDEKMFLAQEIFYRIRHMNFEDFKNEFYSEEGMKELWNQFKKGMDLNLQRNDLIDEIDSKIVEIIKSGLEGKDLESFVQRKYKTY